MEGGPIDGQGRVDISRFFSGEHEYARLVVREYSPVVRSICRKYAEDDDHELDLYQTVWMKAYASAASYRANASFRTWLGRLARNACICDYRSRQRTANARDEYSTLLATETRYYRIRNPGESSDAERIRRLVQQAIYSLPPRERQAITLRIIEERRPSEVARIMGIAPATVRSHIRHALRRLRDYLEHPTP